MIRVGEPAPDFELESDDGTPVRLEDLRGQRVILYFYPRDDTSGCTKEACGFRDHLRRLSGLDVTVLGVSPDGVESHRKFRDKYRLSFPLLSDPDHRVASAYGAWGKKKLYGREYEGILRSTFVIDPDGKVERVYDKVKPAEHAARVLADLAAAADAEPPADPADG
ncbi:MAG: thioredoxin-dependent thiol peroxidase [Gemmatimonadota bacterium]